MKVWLTNGRSFWQVPPGHIQKLYADGRYRPPEGWRVCFRLPPKSKKTAGECPEQGRLF